MRKLIEPQPGLGIWLSAEESVRLSAMSRDSQVEYIGQKLRERHSKQKKYCSRRDHYVSVKRFAKSTKKEDGLQTWCKDCQIEYRKGRRAAFRNSVEVPSAVSQG